MCLQRRVHQQLDLEISFHSAYPTRPLSRQWLSLFHISKNDAPNEVIRQIAVHLRLIYIARGAVERILHGKEVETAILVKGRVSMTGNAGRFSDRDASIEWFDD